MKFSENGGFLTLGGWVKTLGPSEGEKRWHQVKVMALGAEMEEIHQIPLEMVISVKLAEIA